MLPFVFVRRAFDLLTMDLFMYISNFSDMSFAIFGHVNCWLCRDPYFANKYNLDIAAKVMHQ
jgi:hypothetical protein